MTIQPVTYRCIKLLYPNLDPIFVLEYKNGEWHQLFSTMDGEYFGRHIRKMHITNLETIEVEEA
jgi:hypothetical protein